MAECGHSPLASARLPDALYVAKAGLLPARVGWEPLLAMNIMTNVILYEGNIALAQTSTISRTGLESHTGWVVLEPGKPSRQYAWFSDAMTYLRHIQSPPVVVAGRTARRVQSAGR